METTAATTATKNPLIAEAMRHPKWPDFVAYHRANPQVVALLRQLALQRVRAGFDKVGIKALIEVARWQYELDVGPEADFAVNNSYAPILSRVLAVVEPELANAFEFRAVISKAALDA